MPMRSQSTAMRLIRFSGFLFLVSGVLGYIAPKTSTKIETSVVTDVTEPVEAKDEALDFSRRNLFVKFGVSLIVVESLIGDAEKAMAENYSLDSKQKDNLNSKPASTKSDIDVQAILRKASKKALGGGKAGATAAVVQVGSLMWLRTAMNYQYRYGGNLSSSLKTLWEEGGIARLYQGLPFALVQGPATRFGDTAANVGILALLDSIAITAGLPLPLKTAAGSVAAGLWRIVLMPIDTSKTALQVEGSDGITRLMDKVRAEGPSPLYQGALASAAATAAGHFPWFLTYNFLDNQLPMITANDDLLLSLVRSATLGLFAAGVSDCVSNSLRVVKTTKQTAGLSNENEQGEELSYPEIVRMIIEKDGIGGLLGRGLQTRLLTNAIQGAAFSILWRYFQQVG
eukprot:CAMPEP_0194217158 /NCGR_PEP_ID=MMETSP0156-20130528/20471_1 /TAXON_ID=33649 /ORGANISM="Thalassionema nitzschioides, Strain L26-B" /LENGTH=398 /DNA_ID=CAMNT_0038946117 /DNA_START=1 /DNA_END=1197 /DNA_ORIENTATION=+